MDRFFRPGLACERYARYRDATDIRGLETRAAIEMLWSRVAPFLDDNLPSAAMQHFSSSYWEMELAETLMLRRIPLGQRSGSKGPDIRVVGPSSCWIEAIVPGPGSGNDEVPGLSGPGWVDHEKVILRLRAALKEKHHKYRSWIDRGQIAPREIFVVAVNGSAIAMAMLEPTIPFIVSAVAPFGELTISFDPRDLNAQMVESYRYREAVRNAKGAPIPTTIFTDRSYEGISGVLYSWSDEINKPRYPGGGYTFVHNPMATNPLPPGALSFGREYFIEITPAMYLLRWCNHPV